jgi:hypothetical protein
MKKNSIFVIIFLASAARAQAVNDPDQLAAMINSPGGIAGRYVLQTGKSSNVIQSCPTTLDLKAGVISEPNGSAKAILTSGDTMLEHGQNFFNLGNSSSRGWDRQGGVEGYEKSTTSKGVVNSSHDTGILANDGENYTLKLKGNGEKERLVYTYKVHYFQQHIVMKCIYKRISPQQ